MNLVNYIFIHQENLGSGNSLAAQWLGLSTVTAGARGSVPSWGTKIPQAERRTGGGGMGKRE